MGAFEDALEAAGSQLAAMWKNPAMKMPENNLHPAPDAMAFELKLAKDRIATLENQMAQVIKALQNVKR